VRGGNARQRLHSAFFLVTHDDLERGRLAQDLQTVDRVLPSASNSEPMIGRRHAVDCGFSQRTTTAERQDVGPTRIAADALSWRTICFCQAGKPAPAPTCIGSN